MIAQPRYCARVFLALPLASLLVGEILRLLSMKSLNQGINRIQNWSASFVHSIRDRHGEAMHDNYPVCVPDHAPNETPKWFQRPKVTPIESPNDRKIIPKYTQSLPYGTPVPFQSDPKDIPKRPKVNQNNRIILRKSV